MRRFCTPILRICSLAAVVICSLVAIAQDRPGEPVARSAGSAALPAEATVNDFLKQYFGYNAGLTWTINAIRRAADPAMVEIAVTMNTPDGPQAMRIYLTPDGRHAVAGDWVPFGADPFAPAREELARRATGPARGPEDAALTIVEFADLQCPSCKQAHPTIQRLLTEEPKVRFVYQQFPLTKIHNWAFKASSWAECVYQQNNSAFWKFTDAVYDTQEQITAENADQKLGAAAAQAGADATAAAACAAKPETAAKVNQSMELGKSLEVTGTPTVFVGGRKIANVNAMPYELLKSMVEFYAKQGK